MNAFDQLRIDHRKNKAEAESYNFFIFNGFVTDLQEIMKLYQWFDANSSMRDPEGKSRLRLLRRIPDSELIKIANLEKIRNQPSKLKSEFLKRMPWAQ